LCAPGLRVIEDAIIGARKIFQRMKNYCMYSISVCVRVVFTFGILTLAYDWYFPTIGIVFFAIINDFSMLTIAKDRVKPSPVPDEWNLKEIFGIAIAFGIYLTASTVIFYSIARKTDFFEHAFHLKTLDLGELRSLVYVQVSISGLSAIFVTRAYGWSYLEKPAPIVALAFVMAQSVASILGAYGLGGYPNDCHNETRENSAPLPGTKCPGGLGRSTDWRGAGWGYVLLAWIWCLIWYVMLDPIKFFVRGMAKGKIRLFHYKVHMSKKQSYGHPYHGDHPKVAEQRASLAREVIQQERPSLDIVPPGARENIMRESIDKFSKARTSLERESSEEQKKHKKRRRDKKESDTVIEMKS